MWNASCAADGRDDRSEVGVEEHEHEISRRQALERDTLGAGHTGGAHDRPADDRVQHADHDDGGVRRPRDGPARLLGLLAEECGRLEAEEEGGHEEERDPNRTANEDLGAEGEREGLEVEPCLNEHRRREREDDQGLQDECDAEDAGAHVDAGAREQEAPDEGDRAGDEPVHFEAEQRWEYDRTREEADRPGSARHEGVVSESGDQAGDKAGAAAEALDRDGIEPARVHELLRHLGVPDGEEEERDRHHDDRERDAAPVAEGDGERKHDDRAGERRHGCQDEEDDGGDTELVALERLGTFGGHADSFDREYCPDCSGQRWGSLVGPRPALAQARRRSNERGRAAAPQSGARSIALSRSVEASMSSGVAVCICCSTRPSMAAATARASALSEPSAPKRGSIACQASMYASY